MQTALTYDDIQLVPKYSEVQSRQNVSLRTKVSKNYYIDMPIVAAPMDTVCGYEMAKLLLFMGGVGCVHRFMSIEEQANVISKLNKDRAFGKQPIMACVGVNGDFLERTQELIKFGTNIIIIDVAHGHHKNVQIAIDKIKSIDSSIDIIAGNIATKQASIDLINWGADGLRVGIGGGSLCTTRVQTGFGIPNVTAIQSCLNDKDIPVMADGGLRSSGDMAKALGIGADCIMLGSLLAGTAEAPGSIQVDEYGTQTKLFRGSASLSTKKSNNQSERNVEGESTTIPYKGSAKPIISNILDGIRSAFSYTGAMNIEEYHEDVEFVRVTNAGNLEGKPHLLF